MLRIVQHLFQRRLKRWEYAGLAGAPDDAEVEVGTLKGELYLHMHQPKTGWYCGVQLVRRSPSGPVLVNESLHIHRKAMRRKGLGLQIFSRQLDHAFALNVKRIETVAGRNGDENGYYTWPRFGFDGPVPAEIIRNLPIGLEHVRSVLDLMECEKGRLWWKEHGNRIHLVFDVNVHSRCWQMFRQYRDDRLAGGPRAQITFASTMPETTLHRVGLKP